MPGRLKGQAWHDARKPNPCPRCGAGHPPPEARCTRYNGWSNYETWAVNLWLTNEPGTSEELTRIAAPYRDGIGEDVYIRADRLKAWVRDEVCGEALDGASLATDLLGAALSEVDWQEIIENHERDNGAA